MKYPSDRKTTAIGKTKSGFAIYKSKRSCLRDYRIWQDKYGKGLSRAQYIRLLRKVYSMDEKYLKTFGY